MIEAGPESRKEWLLSQFAFQARKHKRNSQHQFWIQSNHPVQLTSPQFMEQKLEYIHENPVKAGWVNEACNYIYSSARDYQDINGPV